MEHEDRRFLLVRKYLLNQMKIHVGPLDGGVEKY